MKHSYTRISTSDLPLHKSSAAHRYLRPPPPLSHRCRPILALFVILTFTISLSALYIYNLSPYALTLLLEATIPCGVHLQAKCFRGIARDWDPRGASSIRVGGEEEAWLDRRVGLRFGEQCGDWRAWTGAFEQRQREVMAGDRSVGVVVW